MEKIMKLNHDSKVFLLIIFLFSLKAAVQNMSLRMT
jgi:hypothetical protein